MTSVSELHTPLSRGRGRPRSDQTERAILEATKELLEECGFADLTIEDVARRAGVGKTTIYRRWPGKGTLVFQAFMVDFLARQPLPDTGTLRGDLLSALRSWIRVVKGTGTGRTLLGLLGEVERDPELAHVWRDQFVTPVRAQHRIMFERGIERGEILATTDVEVAMDLLYGPAYHRLIQTQLSLSDRFAQNVVDTIIRGLKSDTSTA